MKPRHLPLLIVLLIAMFAIGGAPSQALADSSGCCDVSARVTASPSGPCGAGNGGAGELCHMAQGCALQAAKIPAPSIGRSIMPIARVAYQPVLADAAPSITPRPELTPPRT